MHDFQRNLMRTVPRQTRRKTLRKTSRKAERKTLRKPGPLPRCQSRAKSVAKNLATCAAGLARGYKRRLFRLGFRCVFRWPHCVTKKSVSCRARWGGNSRSRGNRTPCGCDAMEGLGTQGGSQCPEVAVSRRWRMWHPGGSVPWDVPSGGASVPRGQGHPVELWPRGVVGPGMDGQGGVAPRVVCVRSKSVPRGPCPGAGFGTYELPAPKEEGGGRSVGELAPGRLWHPRAVHPEGVPQPGGRCQQFPALRDIGTPRGVFMTWGGSVPRAPVPTGLKLERLAKDSKGQTNIAAFRGEMSAGNFDLHYGCLPFARPSWMTHRLAGLFDLTHYI